MFNNCKTSLSQLFLEKRRVCISRNGNEICKFSTIVFIKYFSGLNQRFQRGYHHKNIIKLLTKQVINTMLISIYLRYISTIYHVNKLSNSIYSKSITHKSKKRAKKLSRFSTGIIITTRFFIGIRFFFKKFIKI